MYPSCKTQSTYCAKIFPVEVNKAKQAVDEYIRLHIRILKGIMLEEPKNLILGNLRS